MTFESIMAWALPLSQVIGAIATAAAFWVTFLTLRELRRQTGLANNPHLKIRIRAISKDIGDLADGSGELIFDTNPHETWQRIIHNNLRQDLSQLKDNFLYIEFTNGGKSEITQIRFDYRLDIRMFENDILEYGIDPPGLNGDHQIICELTGQESFYLSIDNTRYFPIYSLNLIDVKYRDVRGNEYTDFDGPTQHGPIENNLLVPVEPQEDEEMPIVPDEDEIPF